jgi:hypothetical protein
VALKARKIGTVARLKAASKKGGGGEDFIKGFKDNEPATLRFLTEPLDWIEYVEHYNEEFSFFPCSDDCPACKDGVRGSKKFLAAAIDVEEGVQTLYKLPKTVMSSLNRSYERNGTILDRDFEIIRTGSRLDTEYDVAPAQPSRVKLSRFPVPNGGSSWPDYLMKVLDKNLPENKDKSDEDDEPPMRKKTSRNGSSNGVVKSSQRGSLKKSTLLRRS